MHNGPMGFYFYFVLNLMERKNNHLSCCGIREPDYPSMKLENMLILRERARIQPGGKGVQVGLDMRIRTHV